MQLNPTQARAARDISNFARQSGTDIFRMTGYAGTGKSTVIREVAQNLKSKKVYYATPTAKAAQVLAKKGLPAQTIHSLIYKPYERINNRTNKPELAFVKNDASPLQEGGLVVVDESSMVSAQMMEDLMSFPIRIVAVGDPGQLPPVRSHNNISLLSGGPPDAHLEEVVRTAIEDSPITSLATHVRTKGSLPKRNGGRKGSKIVDDLSEVGDIDTDDTQIIVGKHATRHRINNSMRSQLGFKNTFPEFGDKVICKKNDPKRGLYNGQQFKVHSVDKNFTDDALFMSVNGEEGAEVGVGTWTHGFTGKQGQELLSEMPFKDRGKLVEMWYSYAITCHSSQGSEWPHVVVLDEGRTFGQNYAKWVYTAITRAQETVTVVRG